MRIPGIDWKTTNEGLEPRLDPLAYRFPFDQHALFAPSAADLALVLDALDPGDRHRSGLLSLASSFDARSEERGVRARYERQLCARAAELAAVLAPGDASQAGACVFTGSDPYLRTGSDVALLWGSGPLGLLARVIEGNQRVAAKASDVQRVAGDMGA